MKITTKTLIVSYPWIGFLLDEKKTWEMRPIARPITPDRVHTDSSPSALMAYSDAAKVQGAVPLGSAEPTHGNIAHLRIYLGDLFDRSPDGAVGGSNRHQKTMRDILINWGSASTVQTAPDGIKRFFGARGWIKNFFETNDAAAGDSLLVKSPGSYRYRTRLKK